MKPYILFFLFSSFLVSSQTPISKTLGEFSELKVYDLINIELVQSTENKMKLQGRTLPTFLSFKRMIFLKLKWILISPLMAIKRL